MPVAAVLFDRDGTLIHDVPYNHAPARVEPLPGVRVALDRLRRLGVPLGVVTNQSGVARGLIRPVELERVNNRVEELLGPFDTWAVCPHHAAQGCRCRKPRPGLIRRAAAMLGVTPRRCAVIGDIASDMAAADAAGAWGILVPTPQTRSEEIIAAPDVAHDLTEAINRVLRRGTPAGTAGHRLPRRRR